MFEFSGDEERDLAAQEFQGQMERLDGEQAGTLCWCKYRGRTSPEGTERRTPVL